MRVPFADGRQAPLCMIDSCCATVSTVPSKVAEATTALRAGETTVCLATLACAGHSLPWLCMYAPLSCYVFLVGWKRGPGGMGRGRRGENGVTLAIRCYLGIGCLARWWGGVFLVFLPFSVVPSLFALSCPLACRLPRMNTSGPCFSLPCALVS